VRSRNRLLKFGRVNSVLDAAVTLEIGCRKQVENPLTLVKMIIHSYGTQLAVRTGWAKFLGIETTAKSSHSLKISI
jgi:hypothetical protein